MTATGGESTRIWWHHPIVTATLVVVPTAALALAVSPDRYLSEWREPKVFNSSAFLMVMAALATFLLGAIVGGGWAGLRPSPARRWPNFSEPTNGVLRRSFPWLLGLTLLGYAVWVANGVRHGLSITGVVDALRSQDTEGADLRDVLVNVPGITTLTQIAIPMVIVAELLRGQARRAGQTLDRLVRWGVPAVLVITVARAYLVQERAALIELIVPMAAIRTAYIAHSGRRYGRMVARLGPILAIPLLLFGFAAFEFSRSWVFYSEERDEPFVEFASYRLMGYYATSYNNGAMGVNEFKGKGYLPFMTIEAVREFPLMNQVIPESKPLSDARYAQAFEERLNPEFNSPGGMTSPYAEWGYAIGSAYLLIFGLLIGISYRSFTLGRLGGVLTYPIFFTGLLEMPRGLYWPLGRVTPAWLAVFVIVTVASRSARETLAAQSRRLRTSAWTRTSSGIA